MSPPLGLSTGPSLTLRHKLLKERREWCNKQRHFIPIDQVEKHVTLSNVKDELKKFPDLSEREIADIAGVICTRSKKLFTAFRCGAPEDHFQYIQAVLGEGITDDNIPFSRVELSRAAPEDTAIIGLARRGHDKCEKSDHTSCVIRVFLKWNEIDITNLLRDQWLPFAPVFQSLPGQIPHFDLDPEVVLPFLYVPQTEIKIGGFGEVSQIKIHPAHQKLLLRQDPRNSENPLLADKELFSKDIKMFQDERVMHEAVTSKNHKHLIKLLATYKLADKFHLLFLYANSNLRAYWNNVDPTPCWEKEKCIWSLRQMRGLASGIHVIHEFNNKQPLLQTTRSKESAFHRPNYGANIMKVDPSEALYGRHGDLKPENILWINVEDEFGKGGYLQVADFGLGRFHRQDSRSRVDPKTVLGSATYIPPELVLEEYISRAYDIWSLGCIFLEFITWMLDGKQGLERFVEARVAMAHDNVEDDTFFTASMETPKHAEVRPGVKSWIDSLRQHRNCSSMIHDLLNLVQAKMLRVQSTERIRSEPLVVELDAILKKGERDHIYLLEISSNR